LKNIIKFNSFGKAKDSKVLFIWIGFLVLLLRLLLLFWLN
jgi:hypothetical protein